MRRTLEDIDRFFETEPGIFIHRNKLAVQLQRPTEFIEADERIANAQDGMKGGEKDPESLTHEHIDTKESM
jgi:hypothetical protein